VTERVLNRLPYFDERSRAYNIRAVVDRTIPRSFTWACAANLDQRSEGACVGFGWTHEAIARPREWNNLGDGDARSHYREAQKIDPWPGENYEGTAVIAGAKVAQQRGYIGEYRWAFSTQDALAAISRKGPAVIGVNWYTGMFDTDANGFIRPTGRVAGGHCILVRGVNVKAKTVLLHNSWGKDWGGTRWGPGTALLTWDDFDRLLREDGECCIPVERK
jgi:hypothetical protein